MMYQDSVEEQRYLTNVRREKEAFEQLIRTKAVSGFEFFAKFFNSPDNGTLQRGSPSQS